MNGEKRKVKVLFVCTANQQRSPTAEAVANLLYPEHFEARSCGVAVARDLGGTMISRHLVEWADEIVTMEPWHNAVALARCDFANVGEAMPHGLKLQCLQISDQYNRHEPTLVQILRRACEERIASGKWPGLGMTWMEPYTSG